MHVVAAAAVEKDEIAVVVVVEQGETAVFVVVVAEVGAVADKDRLENEYYLPLAHEVLDHAGEDLVVAQRLADREIVVAVVAVVGAVAAVATTVAVAVDWATGVVQLGEVEDLRLVVEAMELMVESDQQYQSGDY